jgi:hypothetical protein
MRKMYTDFGRVFTTPKLADSLGGATRILVIANHLADSVVATRTRNL